MMELVYLASSWPTPSWLSMRKSYPLATHTFFSFGVSTSRNGNRQSTHTINTTQVHKYTSNTTHKQSKQTENNPMCEVSLSSDLHYMRLNFFSYRHFSVSLKVGVLELCRGCSGSSQSLKPHLKWLLWLLSGKLKGVSLVPSYCSLHILHSVR